ncbi:hypothetical protein [Stenotrophomonas sp.]|jgi:hypothetical protein|uniref:hypothetical protein n=1 Tax=unclassified Stenotrophomonas TaxID=196198 RepID=UPI0028AC6FD9|nr:hypothetical protein [Stenotrophomonas sp.]
MHTTSLDVADDATACAFFRIGLVLGVLDEEASREWAYARIEARDTPAIEIIEIATAYDRNAALDALQAVTAHADWPAAGRWLLEDLLAQFQSGQRSALDTCRTAMQVARATQLPEDVYYAFDGLEDELVLLANGIYGTVAGLEADLVDALKQHSGTV